MDTCDRCGAAGKSRFVKGKLELIFCGHHAREFALELVHDGFTSDAVYAADESLVNA